MHLPSPIYDGDLGKWVLAKARDIEILCVSEVHGDSKSASDKNKTNDFRVNDRYSSIDELNTYGKLLRTVVSTGYMTYGGLSK